MMKRCPRCGVDKPIDSFAHNRSARDGRQSYCKPCFLDKYVRDACPDCGQPKAKQSARCHSCAPRRFGADNGAWKGGRIVRPDRYVDVCRPGHPSAGKNGYVKEHRLVMEETLGRHLLSGENVHHINGVKDDNRPENLELWVTKQPKGQRPADLVPWAREILRRYGQDHPLIEGEPPP